MIAIRYGMSGMLGHRAARDSRRFKAFRYSRSASSGARAWRIRPRLAWAATSSWA